MAVILRTLLGDEYAPQQEDLAFECFCCGLCCVAYWPQLSEEEVNRMSASLSISRDKFIAKYIKITTIGYLIQQTDTGCIFLNWNEDGKTALCSVHKFRPDACRNWQAGVFRRECREGLERLKRKDELLLAAEVYPNPEELTKFCSLLQGT